MGEWCEVRREHARQRLAKVRPAAKSTGPKTPQGKRKVAVNFYPIEQREFMGDLIDLTAEINQLDSMPIDEMYQS